jgi:hypothetical protein
MSKPNDLPFQYMFAAGKSQSRLRNSLNSA